MTDIAILRASSLPLAFRCPASLRRNGLLIDPVHGSAADGTAAHECLRSLAETGALDWARVREIAERSGADVEQVRMLCAMGVKLWSEVSASFPEALTEVWLSSEAAPGVLLTGHVDLLSVRGTVARAGDWKTGRKDSDYSHQMRAYGALVMLDNPELTEVTVTVLWVRDQEIENYTMTRESARSWLRQLVEQVVEWDGVYRPGSHCAHCPRSHECDAAKAMVRRDLDVVADPMTVARAEGELALMSPAEIVGIFKKADLVVRYAERVRSAIRAHVEAHGDIVADGTRLTVVSEQRREVDPLKAWPVLEAAGFRDEDFAAAMTLSASRLEKVIASKAQRGKGAKAVRAFQEALKGVGAIQVREIKKLQAKRA